MQVDSSQGIAGFLADPREAIYESNKREPLGRAHIRGHRLPDQHSDPRFRFGQATNAPNHPNDQNGKDVISPIGAQVDEQFTHEQYVRSHYAFSPGEQVQRRYAWPTAVAEDPWFRFGRLAKTEGRQDSVASAVFGGASGSAEEAPREVPQLRVVQKNGEDFRQSVLESLGKGRTGLQGPPPVPLGFTYGSRTKYGDTAGEAIRGNYTPEEMQPDHDLGKCTREGRRNIAPGPHHIFGKPSGMPRAASAGALRPSFQTPPPKNAALNDDTAQGSGLKEATARRCLAWTYDSGADQAISPDCATEAIANFAQPRSRQEVRDLLEGIDCDVAPGEFEQVWEAAVSASTSGKGARYACSKQVSLNAFVKAYADLKSAAAVDPRAGVGAHRAQPQRAWGAWGGA